MNFQQLNHFKLIIIVNLWEQILNNQNPKQIF
jgi:hypothetical protein